MNYRQVEQYLYSQLPVFHRQGASAYKANLNSTIELLNLLDNPQTKFKSIHVAGTNGKGSSSHLLASIMYEHGLRTGLHTSPHLKDLTERIVVNGKQAHQNYVIQFVKKNRAILEKVSPSFFEMMVSMAFNYFVTRVDIAVIEVGMGGRLDSTNVITPEVSLITNISNDHTQFLGDTLQKIANEKAGIIKPSIPIVISQTQDDIKSIFIAKARENGSRIYFADENFSISGDRIRENRLIMNIHRGEHIYLENLSCDLVGDYQKKNILGVIQTIEALNASGKYSISREQIRKGIEHVQKNFTLMGRWQTICRNPLTICDTGHNEEGIRFVTEQLRRTIDRKLHIVFGIVEDKDSDAVIDMLPRDAEYYLCRANITRGLAVERLGEQFHSHKFRYSTHQSVKLALRRAQSEALRDGGVVFVGGSTYVVAEIL